MARCAKDNLMSNGVFCREGWVRIMSEMCDTYDPGYDRRRIKSRLQTLKTNYSNINKVLAEFMFGWVEERMMVTADWVHLAMLFYRRTTIGHQNIRARASLLWLTWNLCLLKG
ncbi:hypothetical protein AMTRI_Chr09g37880 [Amborella trichopoda]